MKFRKIIQKSKLLCIISLLICRYQDMKEMKLQIPLLKNDQKISSQGQNPCVTIKLVTLKKGLRYGREEQERYWNELPDDRCQFRKLIKYSIKRTMKFLELNKLEMRKITTLLTGYCSLKANLKKSIRLWTILT